MSRRAEGNRKSGSTGERLQSKRAASVQSAYSMDEGGGGGVARQHPCKPVCVCFLVQLATSSLIAQSEGGNSCAIISASANKIKPDFTCGQMVKGGRSGDEVEEAGMSEG